MEIESDFTYILHNFTIYQTECQNILFKLNENNSNIVILGAHYDSRARATRDPISSNRSHPVPGANDGASGSAVLIELARALNAQKEDLSCQIWFLFFDAEDQGRDNSYGIDGWDWCEGSKQFVYDINDFYKSETESFDAMILFDMVGGDNLRFINEQYSTSSLLDELFTIGRNLGYTNQFPSNPQSSGIVDDHRAFLNIGIPSADLIINFWDDSRWDFHHTTQDDLFHISNYSLEVSGKTIEQFIYNNYFIDSNNLYEGNYPWNRDSSIPDMQVLITVLIFVAIAGVSIIIVISYNKLHQKNLETIKQSSKKD